MNRTQIEWTDCSLIPVVGCSDSSPSCRFQELSKKIAMIKAAVWLRKKGIPYSHLAGKELLKICRSTPVWCEECCNFKPHFHWTNL